MKEADVEVKRPTPAGPRVIDTVMNAAKLSSLRERLGLVYGTDRAEVDRLADLEGANVDVFRDIISQVQKNVRGWGGSLYFVYVPSWKHYLPDDPTKDARAEFGIKERSRILALIGEMGIPIIDVEPVLEGQKDPPSLLPFRKPGHFNEEGHRLIAETIIKGLSHSQQSTNLDHKPASHN